MENNFPRTIIFLRHARLAQPYDDYGKLSFSQICKLATGAIDPEINQSQEIKNKSFLENEIILKEIDIIYCSPSKRAIQTASLLVKLTKSPKLQIKNSILSEIVFNPSLLVREDDYLQFGMEAIRLSLFRALVKEKKGVEPLESIFRRIRVLEKELKNFSYQNILCITHGFYMRVMQLYFLKGITQSRKVILGDLQKAVNYSYLEGFKVKV